MQAHKIYLGLGSNLGDRAAYLDAAIAAMPPAVNVLRRSPIYETAPWGFTEQDNFLNMVVEGETDLVPAELLAHLKNVETIVGRQPRFRNGPREIDIDILLYDDLVQSEGGLTLPHPRLHERTFMLAPLADLAPELTLPGTQTTISELLAALEPSGVKRYE